MPSIQFVNTDLDLEAPFNLAELCDLLVAQDCRLLGPIPVENGIWRATLEAQYGLVETFGHLVEPERTVQALLSVLETLTADGKELWNRCTVRRLDLGFKCGTEPWPFYGDLRPETLARIVTVGAELRITIYPEVPPSQSKRKR